MYENDLFVNYDPSKPPCTVTSVTFSPIFVLSALRYPPLKYLIWNSTKMSRPVPPGHHYNPSKNFTIACAVPSGHTCG